MPASHLNNEGYNHKVTFVRFVIAGNPTEKSRRWPFFAQQISQMITTGGYHYKEQKPA